MHPDYYLKNHDKSCTFSHGDSENRPGQMRFSRFKNTTSVRNLLGKSFLATRVQVSSSGPLTGFHGGNTLPGGP